MSIGLFITRRKKASAKKTNNFRLVVKWLADWARWKAQDCGLIAVNSRIRRASLNFRARFFCERIDFITHNICCMMLNQSTRWDQFSGLGKHLIFPWWLTTRCCCPRLVLISIHLMIIFNHLSILCCCATTLKKLPMEVGQLPSTLFSTMSSWVLVLFCWNIHCV